MNSRNPQAARPWLGLALAIGLMLPTAVLAQSSYTVSTLKAPNTAVPLATTFQGRGVRLNQRGAYGIDINDRVVGRAAYANGFYIDTNRPYIRARYDEHLVSWPASTATAVSPVKILKSPYWPELQLQFSPDANQVLMDWGSASAVYNMTTKKLGATLPKYYKALGLSNAAAVLWVHADANSGGTWSEAAGTSLLSIPPREYYVRYVLPEAFNNKGQVIGHEGKGSYVDNIDMVARVVQWQSGQIVEIDNRPERYLNGSYPLAINDAGQVLVETYVNSCRAVNQCLKVERRDALLVNGQFLPITPPIGPAAGVITSRALMPDGTVFGTWRQPLGGFRGFTWKNNQFTDVTDMLAAKRVALPTGSVVADVLAMNAKGSMVVQVISASGVQSIVRLSAKP